MIGNCARHGELLVLFILLALFLWPSEVAAQIDRGTVTGRVIDPTGAVIPDATVTVFAVDTRVSTRTLTNMEGFYTLTALLIGRYEITVEKPGFKRYVGEPLEIHAQARVRVDVTLALGGVAQEVSIAERTPLLETETSSLSHVVSDDQIRGLPLNGRNFQQLAGLVAGVLPAFGHIDREGGFNAHGQWATQNNFILDGVDNNSQIFGFQDRKGQVVIPSLDAVQEFQIHTANYSVEFGRSAGAVMNVSTKSGTNSVRGTLYAFFQNDVFDARDAFDYFDRTGDAKSDPDARRQNQYGFTIGGPIRRNRTFYFASVEATRSRTTRSSLVIVPTLLERQGTFDPQVIVVRDPATVPPFQPFDGNTIPRERWDPVAARMVSLWPEPNFVGITRHNYVSAPKDKRDRYQYDMRFDHNFSSRDRMFLRMSASDADGVREGPLPAPAVGGPDNDTARDQNDGIHVAVSESHVLGSRLVNEARFGFASLTTDKRPFTQGFPNENFGLQVASPRPVEGLARLLFAGALNYAPLGESGFNPNYKVARTLQFLDNLAILTSRHTLKLGVDLRRIESNIIGAPQARGIFNFNGRFTGSSLGDFLLGMTNTRQFSTFQEGSLRERDYMFYVQDDWRIGPRLTLNLGLRYELASPMFDSQNRMSTLDVSMFPLVTVVRAGERGSSWSDRGLVDTDSNNWAPRVGFAYQPAPQWTVRAAAGVFYAPSRAGAADLRLINNWPHYRDVTAPSTPTRSAGQLQEGIALSLLGNPTQMPDNLNWNVWAKDFKLPTIYQWNLSVQRQLGRSVVVTTAYVGSSSNYLARWHNINAADPGDPTTERQRRPIPQLGAITYRQPAAQGNYHALETTLAKRLSGGVQFSLAYTWSHAIDDTAEQFSGEGAVIQDKNNLRGDKGNSWFDRRHRLAGFFLFDLPFGANGRWLRNDGISTALFGGWQLSGIVSVQSGPYVEVTVPQPTRLGVTQGNINWRADLIGDPRVPQPGADGWLNPAAFGVPQNADGTYRYGNLGRNSLVGPGFFNLDASLAREFLIDERRRLQLRWEVFNVTNHPSYGLPNSVLGSEDFGTIRSTFSTPRQMQFGVKVTF